MSENLRDRSGFCPGRLVRGKLKLSDLINCSCSSMTEVLEVSEKKVKEQCQLS